MVRGVLCPHGMRYLVLTLAALAWADSTALSPEVVLARMEQTTDQRFQALRTFQGKRRYFVQHPLLPADTSILVAEEYRDGKRSFKVLERHGPSEIHQKVFKPLMDAETLNDAEPERQAVEVCRRNYEFTWVRTDPDGAFVFRAEPRTANRYLFRGLIWIDPRQFAVRRIEGEPAQPPSALVSRTRFVHEFTPFGPFWLQTRHRAQAQLRLLGKAQVGIDYFDYDWQPK